MEAANRPLTLTDIKALELDDIVAYADALRRASRGLPDPVPGPDWMALYERGLKAALDARDSAGIAAMVAVLINRLDRAGRLGDAVVRINHALAFARGQPAAQLRLLAIKAKMLAGQSEFGPARQAIAEAALYWRGGDERGRREFRSTVIMLNCLTIRAQHVRRVSEDIGELLLGGDDAQSSLCMTWFVPYLIASGLASDTEPWIQTLRLTAESAGHVWRAQDAASFAWAVEFSGPLGGVDPPLTGENWVAAWRVASIALRGAMVRSDWAGAARSLAALTERSPSAYPGLRPVLANLASLLRAYQGADASPVEPPVDGPSLFDLAGVLAGMEAAAIGGASDEALRWLRWARAQLPPRVATAIDWPVVRWRVEALLHARVGESSAAVSLMQRAIAWADERGYVVERAIAQLQLAEILAHRAWPVSNELVARRLRRTAWDTLRELGIDPTPHAYAATRAVQHRGETTERTLLSAREVEVLSLLAEGLSYREAAARLGLSWRTVQSHAYRAYDKLDVNKRTQAVARARALGLLSS